MRSVTPSPFRPAKPVDQTILKENRKLVESIERRAFLLRHPEPRRAHQCSPAAT
jgi:hypothetical protein